MLAVGLVMSGISDAFGTELDRTFSSLDADSFMVPEGVSGPLTGAQPFAAEDLPDGVSPMAYLIQTANPSDPEMVAVIGLEPGAAEPAVQRGAQLSGQHDALVGNDSGFDIGDTLEVADLELTVVGHVDGLSVNAGMPMVVVPLDTFQGSLLGGLPLATAGIVSSDQAVAPQGFKLVDVADARDDALRILGDATSTISLIEALLWIVAALIVGSVMYLSAVERTRDFAVFRAIGTSTGALASGVVMQAGVLALVAGAIGVGVAYLLAPIFPMNVDLSLGAVLGLPLLALIVGVVSGVFALRRAISVEPAEAFAGAA